MRREEIVILRILDVAVTGPQRMRLSFNNGSEKQVDVRPLLHGPVFEPLLNPDYFARATLDPVCGTVVWPNGADFDPATLHEWPRVRAELAARARAWAEPNNERRANIRMEPTRR
jgi:hypothetical protein